jgi:hypothetical protein
MPKLKGLSIKQQKFIDAYLGPAAGNGSKAAQLAGYRGSPQTLKAIASENLTKPYIAREIEKCLRTVMTGETVLEELSELARAVCSEPVRVTDKLKALDLMGKHHRLFNEPIAAVYEDHINSQSLTVTLQEVLSLVISEQPLPSERDADNGTTDSFSLESLNKCSA